MRAWGKVRSRGFAEMLEPRRLISGTPLSATAAQRAIASYNAMQTYLYRSDSTNLYRDRYPVQSGDSSYSDAWPLSQASNATVDLANLGNYQADIQARVAALGHYYSSNGEEPNKGLPGPLQPSPPGYDSAVDPPLGGGGDKYYDDNAWIGLASMQQYQQTGDSSALARAQIIFTLITAGWDTNTSHPDPGGVFWTQWTNSQDRNTVSNMPGAELGLRLFEATHDTSYLDWATRMYNWVYTYMRDPSDGLFWDHVNLAGTVEKTKWSYNQGTPIGANVLFYQVTGNPVYLQRAEQIANASLSHYSSTFIQQPVAFDAIFLRNLLLLYQTDHNSAYATFAINYGDQIWNTKRDATTGLFRFGTDGETPLLDQAAATQVFALLASSHAFSSVTVTNTLDSGPASLRDAVQNSSADIINFFIPTNDPNYNPTARAWTITLSSPLLVNRPLTISGPGANLLNVSGNGTSRVLQVSSGVVAEVDGLSIISGRAADGSATSSGQSGGGIANLGVLLLKRDSIQGNTAGSGASGGSGGGISNEGILSAYSSAFLNNTAGAGNGGSGGSGGGIANTGILNLDDCTVANNSSANGTSGGSGGGIFNAGSVTFTNTTVAGNVTRGAGGGLFTSGRDATLYNTIVANNTTSAGSASDVGGTLDARLLTGQSASSNNLIGAGGAGGLANGVRGNIVSAGSGLGTLGNYGGPTATIPLMAGSPALNAGSNTLAAAAGITSDQRGLSRIFSGTTDIGADEAQLPAVAGDVNHDGSVNFSDLLILAQHYGATQPLFEGGDLDGDGSVTFADLLFLAQHYG